jgi:hypothetical protein
VRRLRTAKTIGLTAAATGLAITLAMNFAVPEKQLERHIAHRYGLQCGLLAFGFARVHCSTCKRDDLVAFSC